MSVHFFPRREKIYKDYFSSLRFLFLVLSSIRRTINQFFILKALIRVLLQNCILQTTSTSANPHPQNCIMGSMMRSILLVLTLASSCLFKPTNTYPHPNLGIEGTPLAISSGAFISNGTIEHSKRQDGTPCDDGPCHYPLSEDTRPPPELRGPRYFPMPENITCEPSPPPGEKYRDSRWRKMRMAADFFCRHFSSTTVTDYTTLKPIANSVNVTGGPETFWGADLPQTVEELDDQEVKWNLRKAEVYTFRVELVEGCETPDRPEYLNNENMAVHLWWPLPGVSCVDVMSSAWKRCNNKGRGGSLQAGCLRYGIRTVY